MRNSGDFFVAGRRLTPGLLFSTILAANIGAGSTVGATALGYVDGVGAWWWNGSAGIGTLVLALWIGPRIWRLATAHGFYTIGDFLEHRYSREVRGIVAVLIWLGTLFILAGQLIGASWILQAVAGVPRYVGALVGGLVMTTYFIAGGLLSSAWVNRVQLVVILGGFAVAAPFVLVATGGWSDVRAVPALPEGFMSFWHSSGMGSGWTWLALLGPAFIISPGLVQKAYGAADERTVRIGVGLSAIVLMIFACFPMALGMVARARHPDLVSPDLALPTILIEDLPTGFGALALAAVFSAEVSSADAVLFMLSTSLSQDLYRRFFNPAASEARLLAVGRATALLGGALGIALAIVVPTVVGALTVFYTVLIVSLFVPLVAGLYTRRPGAAAALISIAAGLLTLLAVHVWTAGRGFGLLTPNMLGLLAAAVGFLLMGAGQLALRR